MGPGARLFEEEGARAEEDRSLALGWVKTLTGHPLPGPPERLHHCPQVRPRAPFQQLLLGHCWSRHTPPPPPELPNKEPSHLRGNEVWQGVKQGGLPDRPTQPQGSRKGEAGSRSPGTLPLPLPHWQHPFLEGDKGRFLTFWENDSEL